MVGRGSEPLSGGGVLLVGSSDQTIPITLQRHDNTYQLHIPDDAAVLGLRVCFQVLQRDRHGRVCLSNGLEMLIQ
jgi:hypothetical protein